MTMRLLLTEAGALLGLAKDDPGWVVPPGGRVIDVPLTFADLDAAEAARAGASQPAELAYDATKGALIVRTRALSAEETQEVRGRDRILATAQGAVGKPLAALTATERNALVAVLLWGAGALTPALTVAPLDAWADGPVRG